MKTLTSMLLTLSLILSVAQIVTACGPNALKSTEKEDPAEDAVLAMEKGDYETATSIMDAALEDEPTNNSYLSIAGAAYALKYGLDPLQFALKFGTSSSSSSSGSSSTLTSMFAYLPAATRANIDGVDMAAAFLQRIPAGERTKADNFKLSLLLVASTNLRVKFLNSSLSGTLSSAEISKLTPADALAILKNLSSASAAIAAATGGNQAEVAAQVTAVQASIASQPGADDNEKLQNYLKAGGK